MRFESHQFSPKAQKIFILRCSRYCRQVGGIKLTDIGDNKRLKITSTFQAHLAMAIFTLKSTGHRSQRGDLATSVGGDPGYFVADLMLALYFI